MPVERKLTKSLQRRTVLDEETEKLRSLAARGVEIFAQDVPTGRQVPLGELLA